MPDEQGLPPKAPSPYKQKFSDDDPEEDEKNKKFRALDEGDIALLKTYGMGPYNKAIDEAANDIKKLNTRINEVVGIKESDTGLAPPSQWDLVSDKQMMQEEQPLQVRALKRGEPAQTSACGAPPLSSSRTPYPHPQPPLPERSPASVSRAHAGRTVHQDHQPRHRRREVRDQREADRQVRGGAGRSRGACGH